MNQYVHQTHILHWALNIKWLPHVHGENCRVKCKLQTLGNSRFGHLCYSLTHCRKSRHSGLKPKPAAWAAHADVRLMWHWRSSAGGVAHGMYHILAQASGKQGGVTRYLSKHCRRFPRSSYSDAFSWRWRTLSHKVCSVWHLCP